MKKITAAAAMLLVSVLMLSTATFAWFAMNTRSNANGIIVEAYSDSNFLEIKSDDQAAEYGINATFQNASATLGLITPKFYNPAEIYTLTVTEIQNDIEYTDASQNYYKLADSDIAGVGAKGNYIVANGDLHLASSTKNLLKNVFFTMVHSSDLVSGQYFELSQNKYVVKQLTNQSAKGLYSAYHYALMGNDDYYNSLLVYYNLANGLYEEVDTTGYIPGTTPVAGLYAKKPGLPNKITTDEPYDGTGVYYEEVSLVGGETAFALYTTLEVGSSLKGYYTIQETPASGTTGNGSKYYLKNSVTNDYSFIGQLDNSVVLANYLYWGRAYSDNPMDVSVNSTLNIIGNSEAPDYYLHRTLYLRQAEGTNNATNLRVSDIRIGGAKNDLSDALRVLLVATSDKDTSKVATVLYNAKDDSISHINGNLAVGTTSQNLFDVLLGDEVETITVNVYVYYDGLADVAKNSALTGALLNGQTIEIEFAIDELDYN